MRLELRGVTKRFGSLTANQDIDLVVEPGQVHAILGENGAGKSTLMNILFGLMAPDAGEILIDDVPVRFGNPRDAIAAGIGMVHQHFKLVPVFTVAENLVLGSEPRRLGFLDYRTAERRVSEVQEAYRLPLDPRAVVEDLPVGVQQRVEIVKALAGKAELLILDEPTGVLTPQEVDHLLEVILALKAAGKSVILISHKLREVRAVADAITVIRRGVVVGTTTAETSEEDLAQLMVGEHVNPPRNVRADEPREVVLSVESLSCLDNRGLPACREVTFDLRAGEIVGVAGVEGNGQTELVEVLLGLRSATGGRVVLDGKSLLGLRPGNVLREGVGHIPADRHRDAIAASFDIASNLILTRSDERKYRRRMTLQRREIRKEATQLMKEFDIRAADADVPVGTLSGGNQQKVVIAREMSRKPRVLFACQPTRGLDIGSVAAVHRRILDARESGTSVLLVSSELDEILRLSDRIMVMFQGRVVGIVGPEVSRRELGLMMSGAGLAPAGEVP